MKTIQLLCSKMRSLNDSVLNQNATKKPKTEVLGFFNLDKNH